MRHFFNRFWDEWSCPACTLVRRPNSKGRTKNKHEANMPEQAKPAHRGVPRREVGRRVVKLPERTTKRRSDDKRTTASASNAQCRLHANSQHWRARNVPDTASPPSRPVQAVGFICSGGFHRTNRQHAATHYRLHACCCTVGEVPQQTHPGVEVTRSHRAISAKNTKLGP